MKDKDDSGSGFSKLWSEPQPQQQQKAAFPEIETPPSLLFPGDRVYVPFDTRSRPESLILLTAIVPANGAAYHQLQNYSFDQHHGQFLILFYSSMRVHITGQRLAPVIHAVVSYKCAVIREWHREFYDPPTRGIPVIDKIEILAAGEN